MMREEEDGLPVEQFIQALTSQLDRAQEAMQLKVKAGMPLTFALKDITVDLRAHVEMRGSVVRLRAAMPGDREASVLRFALTTITRPMIEENTRSLALDAEEPSLNEVLGDEVSEDEKRRLEWAGIRSLTQLRELQRHTGEQAVEQFVAIPATRLRLVLQRASQPFIRRVDRATLPVAPPDRSPDLPHDVPRLPSRDRPDMVDRTPDVVKPILPDRPLTPIDDAVRPPPAAADLVARGPFLRISGANLKEGLTPRVRIDGADVPVMRATEREIVVAPMAHQLGGRLEVETAPGKVVAMALDLPSGDGGDDAR